jgi:predicted nucleic acid-binding protein
VSVYVDTSVFYAIVDSTDSNHRSAAETWQSLLQKDETLVTSIYVVTEIVALLHNRFGTDVVYRFVQDDLPAVTIQWIDQATHNAALSAMLATPGRRGPSLTDCVSFEIIRASRIDSVFVYDRHFEGRGFRLVGQ